MILVVLVLCLWACRGRHRFLTGFCVIVWVWVAIVEWRYTVPIASVLALFAYLRHSGRRRVDVGRHWAEVDRRLPDDIS